MSGSTSGVRHVTLKNGIEFDIVKIAPLFLERLYNDRRGEPKPPEIEIKVAGKKAWQSNPDDPVYIERHAAWVRNNNLRIMSITFTMGVRNDPPEQFLKDMKPEFPEYTDREMKYLWIASLLDTEDSMNELTEIIVGQTYPTEQGVEEAMDTFQSDSGRDGRQGVRTPTGDQDNQLLPDGASVSG